MLIKQHGLNFQFKQSFPALFILFGQEHFLHEKITSIIKKQWLQTHHEDSDEKKLEITHPGDWALLHQEANSYSLFSQALFIDVRYDKKSLEAEGKKFFEQYLAQSNPTCLILIRASHLSLKQLNWAVQQPSVIIIQSKLPSETQVEQWIAEQLRAKKFVFQTQIPQLIYQYTRGNLLACAQIIEKITLGYDEEQQLNSEMIKEQLIDQCEYQVFELGDACLSGDINKALLILRYIMNNATEPTLILWILTQEIRTLLQLKQLLAQSLSFESASKQLNIWTQRAKNYQLALNRHQAGNLETLLKTCHALDQAIKSNIDKHVWRSFELLILSLTLGKEVNFLV